MSGGDWKAMFKAVQENDLELVRFYLRSGVDPNYQHPEFMALPLFCLIFLVGRNCNRGLPSSRSNCAR